MLSFVRKVGLMAAVMMVAGVAAPSDVLSAERTKTNTVMTVGEMCGGCVKKITKRFDEVEPVAKVECDIEKQSVTLIPKTGVRLSPKGIWEIMESIGKEPKKMVTPEGTFTSKPKS